jgi:hypothetical protein
MLVSFYYMVHGIFYISFVSFFLFRGFLTSCSGICLFREFLTGCSGICWFREFLTV